MAEPAIRPRRVLLVTRNFPPLVGGMERVNRHLLSELAREWSVSLCGPRGCQASAPEAVDVAESELSPLPRFILETLWRAWRMARRERPQLVLAGSGLAAPMAWLAARVAGARLAVYLHGLDVIAPSRVYQWVWLPFIRACDIVLVNSENTGRLARSRGVPADRISVLHPGTEVPALDAGAGAGFRAEFGLAQRPLLLSVGRFTRRKGLAEFVSRSLPAVVASHPDVLLVIVGEEASNALHGATGSERDRIARAASAAGIETNLRFLGRCDEAALHAAYQAADCHVFPVLDLPGDVEGFGMVAVESAAHGLSTVAFAVGGVPEAVAEGVSGHRVEAGDYAGMSEKIISLLDRTLGEKEMGSQQSRAFATGFAWPSFGLRLRELLAPAGGVESANGIGTGIQQP